MHFPPIARFGSPSEVVVRRSAGDVNPQLQRTRERRPQQHLQSGRVALEKMGVRKLKTALMVRG